MTHYAKYAEAKSNIELSSASLKWYNIHRPATPVPDELEHLAREYLTAETRAEKLTFDGELGFVILHRCGKDFYFLIVSTWRNENEIWETVYYKDGEKMPGFALFPREQISKPTYCVWELGAVMHEQKSWVRYLTSARDDRDKKSYLEDRFSGEV